MPVKFMMSRYQYTPDTKRTSLQRHEAVMSELEVLNGDVVCLQEVGVDYYPFLVTEMKQRGYTGDFLPKTMGTLEGEATFYKHSMFEKIQVMSPQCINLVPSLSSVPPPPQYIRLM